MKQNVTSDNLIRLRELTEKMQQEVNSEYRTIIIKLKQIIDEGNEKIETSKSIQTKIKCYETMCLSIKNLLKNVRLT